MLFHLTGPPGTTGSGAPPPEEPTLQYSSSMFKDIAGAFKDLAKTQADGFFERVADFENAIMGLSSTFGGGRAFAQTLRDSFAKAEVDIKMMGGTYKDMVDIQQAANEAMGSAAIITAEGQKQLFASISLVEGGMNITKENAKSLIENFTKAGFSVYNIGQEVNKIFNTAKETGANVKLVFDEVEKNMSKLNLFNFKNGVEGMTKMAAQSQMLRVTMQETLDFAEQLYDPEKAVEVASTFQRLGLGSMTNVYELQDMARSDPKKLQEMLASEFTRFVEIDAQTGERRINAMGQEVIRVLSKEVPGLKTDYIVQSGLAMAEFQDKVKKIELPDFAQDESLKNLIYAQAKLGEKGTDMEGKYIINVGGEAKDISTLKDEDLKRVRAELDAQARPNADVIEAQRSSQHELLQLNNSIKALHNFYPSLLASNKTVNEGLSKLGGIMLRNFKEKVMTGPVFGLEKTTTESGGERMDVTKRMGEVNTISDVFLNTMTSSVSTLFAEVLSGTPVVDALKDLQAKLGNAIIGSLPANFEFSGLDKKVFDFVKDAFTKMSTGAMGGINLNPSTSSVSPVSPTTVSVVPASSTPITPLSPSSSVVSLVQSNPFNINLNVNAPNVDQRFKELMSEYITNPIFMESLSSELEKEFGRGRFAQFIPKK